MLRHGKSHHRQVSHLGSGLHGLPHVQHGSHGSGGMLGPCATPVMHNSMSTAIVLIVFISPSCNYYTLNSSPVSDLGPPSFMSS